MNIKINNKKHQIKPASEITVSEYIELFDRFKPETKSLGLLLDYISVTLDFDYKHVADVNLDETTIRRLFAYVGEIKYVEDMPISSEFYYKRIGKRYYQKSINWRSVGIRRLLEERGEENQLKLAVYLLAAYLSENYDAEKVDEIYNDLQHYNAIEVFSFVIFFFKRLYNGKKSGSNYFKRLLKKLSTNILKLSKA